MRIAHVEIDPDLSEMANLFPATTGLPMTVWVSPRGHAQNDARVKVNTSHGNQVDISNCAVVRIRPARDLVEGSLHASDLTAVREWINRNADVLMDYWDGKIDTVQMGQRLIKV